LHWTTEILYTGNSVVNDFETRVFFGLNESIVSDYDVSPLIKIIGEYDKIEVSSKKYAEIENEGVVLNQFLGGPDYIYINNTNSGILILNNYPMAGNVGFSIYKEADVPLSYFSSILYFDSKNNKQTIKLTISLDKELSVAKKKAFEYVSSSPLAIDGKWYITFPRNITDEEIATLKLNNYKFIQIHGTSSCKELLQKHASEADINERKHHKLICRKVVADAAGLVYDMLMEEKIEIILKKEL